MMHPEILQQDLDQGKLYGLNTDNYACDFSITTPEDSSIITSNSYFQTMLPSDINKLSYVDDYTRMENNSQPVEGIEYILGTDLDDVLKWWVESEEMDITSSNIVKSGDIPIVLLVEDLEVEGQTSLCNLLKAYEEAMEMGQEELVKVIVRCINEKASPLGGTMERVAFYRFQSGNQVDYIKQESMKNFKQAFKTFYAFFPYGRFAHFAANSAILEAIMSDSRKVHIIDFDICEGVQWPSMLEAIGKLKGEMKLTSIRTNTQCSNFEETKNRLLDYANSCGLKLEVQDIKIEELVWEIERSREHEFLAFNCMVGLPHMRRTRNKSEVMQFVRTAKTLLLLSTNNGIIAFGDGEDCIRTNVCRGFSSFFDDYIMHYHALCESMERSFPESLTEARIAMESLFVGPNVSSFCWDKNKRRENVFIKDIGLMGCRVSIESLMEAKEMVKEKESLYNIRVEGQNNNEMVLEWRGTPLVTVSAWR